VSGTHWEYKADVCIIWSWFMLHMAEEYVRWSLSLCLACLGMSDGHSDKRLLIMIFSLRKHMGISILINKLCTEIILYFSLFALRRMPNLRKWKMKDTVHSWIHSSKRRVGFMKVVTCLCKQNSTISSNVHYYVQKQVQLLSLLPINICFVFLLF
jgi:hypothetical protein